MTLFSPRRRPRDHVRRSGHRNLVDAYDAKLAAVIVDYRLARLFTDA